MTKKRKQYNPQFKFKVDYGIQIEVVGTSDGGTVLRFYAANKDFAGAVGSSYILDNKLKAFANVFRGFPASLRDSREAELSDYDMDRTGYSAKFRLSCIDRLGNIAIEVQLQSLRYNPNYELYLESSTQFAIFVYPAEIDKFVAAIDAYLNLDTFDRDQIMRQSEKTRFVIKSK